MPLKKGSFIKDDELAGIAIFNNCIIKRVLTPKTGNKSRI